jgi:hypothetical protein
MPDLAVLADRNYFEMDRQYVTLFTVLKNLAVKPEYCSL